MSQVISLASVSRQGKSSRLRDTVIAGVVAHINSSGMEGLSHQAIARRTGLPVVTIQRFGSIDELCTAVFVNCKSAFLELLENEALLEGSFKERVQLFVSLSWRHYRSDFYRAAMEIFIARRGLHTCIPETRLSKCQVTGYIKVCRKIFSECDLNDREFLEVLRTVHCFLNGLAVEVALKSELSNIGGYLLRCTRMMHRELNSPGSRFLK